MMSFPAKNEIAEEKNKKGNAKIGWLEVSRITIAAVNGMPKTGLKNATMPLKIKILISSKLIETIIS